MKILTQKQLKKKKRLVIQSKCSVCGIKKLRFLKEQEAKGLLSNLGNKTPLSKGVTYSACGAFIKNKERRAKFMQTGNKDFIYKNELDKACFEHDMASGESKDLIKKTKSDKVLKEKAFKIANNRNYDGYQRRSASMVYKFFDKKICFS